MIILLAVIARHKALVAQRVALHDAGSHALLDFIVEFGDRADALFLARLGIAPDGQRRAPVARAAEVPVVEVFEPFAEATRARRFGFPENGLVEFHHALAQGGAADKPAVERVVEHGLVGAPAVRVVVHVLFDAECLSGAFHLDAEHDVEVFGLGCRFLVVLAAGIELRVVGILHVAALVIGVERLVHAGIGKRLGAFREQIIFTREVHHGARLARGGNHEERGHFGGFRHLGIVGTECGRDVHDARTVFRGYVVAGNNAEGLFRQFAEAVARHGKAFFRMSLGILAHVVGGVIIHLLRRFHPRHELRVVHADKFCARPAAYDAVGQHLCAGFVALHRGFCPLGLEIAAHEHFSHHRADGFGGVGVVRAHAYIFNIGSHAERGVGGQRPGRGGPGEEHRLSPARHLGLRVENVELRCGGRVLHVAVAARLVQLVRTKPRACGGRVRLNGVALIEQTFLVKLGQEPPKRFDVRVLVGDVRVFHVHPVTHLVAEVGPLFREHHHIFTAAGVVVLDRDSASDVFLRDAQFLFHSEFHGQAVRIPARLTVHLEALHRFVTAEHVLDGACHDVVDAGMPVGGGRSFEEYVGGAALAFGHAFMEKVRPVPVFKD